MKQEKCVCLSECACERERKKERKEGRKDQRLVFWSAGGISQVTDIRVSQAAKLRSSCF